MLSSAAASSKSGILRTCSPAHQVLKSSIIITTRNYAIPKNPTPQEYNYMIDAMKDYVRPVSKPRIPKTPHQFKKDEMLANQWSLLKKIITDKARNDARRRLKLKKAALEALPKELRVEAEKIDWNIIPIQMGVLPHKSLPPQPGYKPPEESLNIEA